MIEGDLYAKTERRGRTYIAVVIKIGWEHREISDDLEGILDCFVDYCKGTKYYGEGKTADVFAIVLATYYSPDGYLYRFEENLPTDFVHAWDASPVTFTLSRAMWRMRKRELKPLPLSWQPPQVGTLAKNVRPPDSELRYDAELLLSEKPWSWGMGWGRRRRFRP